MKWKTLVACLLAMAVAGVAYAGNLLDPPNTTSSFQRVLLKSFDGGVWHPLAVPTSYASAGCICATTTPDAGQGNCLALPTGAEYEVQGFGTLCLGRQVNTGTDFYPTCSSTTGTTGYAVQDGTAKTFLVEVQTDTNDAGPADASTTYCGRARDSTSCACFNKRSP